jgi:hypothetical protein
MFFSVTAAKIYTELEATTGRMMTINSPILSTYQNLSILIIILSIVYRAVMIWIQRTGDIADGIKLYKTLQYVLQ